MSLREVPESQWRGFCEQFTEQHHGEQLSVERVMDSLKVGEFSRRVAFERLELTGDPTRVVIALRDGETIHVSVPHPSRITLALPREGESGHVRIDSRFDAGIILRFDTVPESAGERDSR